MNKKTALIIGLLLAVLLSITCFYQYEKDYASVMAVTGATPIALKVNVPSGSSLTVKGMVKQDYVFDDDALGAFASTRIRVKEVLPYKKFQGAYIYTGIPALNIIEGIALKKPEGAPFDRPLDMIVTFVSRDGKKVHFSYGEITMSDDRFPVTLAYDRQELQPAELKKKEGKKYTKNLFPGNIKGLKVIAPRDRYTTRYLEDIVSVELSTPATPDAVLPKMVRGKKGTVPFLSCVTDGKVKRADFSGMKKDRMDYWVRLGHGQGYKGVSKVSGYNLRTFLKKNFPGCGNDNLFMFVGIDGYRSVLTGEEIFSVDNGGTHMIAIEMDGKRAQGNFTLTLMTDFFVDRDIWGLSHIVILNKPEDGK